MQPINVVPSRQRVGTSTVRPPTESYSVAPAESSNVVDLYVADPIANAIPGAPILHYNVHNTFPDSPTSSTALITSGVASHSPQPVILPPCSQPTQSFTHERAPFVVHSKRPQRRIRRESPATCDTLVVRAGITHPYARIYSKKHDPNKPRKTWYLRLEKMIFEPQEMYVMGDPQRRSIYLASLEAHIDRLHEQLLKYSLAPVLPETLEPYHGLNEKTAKSMLCGLQYDAADIKTKLLELERANNTLQRTLENL